MTTNHARRLRSERGSSPAIVVVLVLMLVGLLVAVLALLFMRSPPAPVRGPRCRMNLTQLGLALRAYAEEHGVFPASDWCDALVTEFAPFPEDVFCCPSAGEGRCHYAMNPLAHPASTADVVLLFECDAGWNQCGRLDALATDHHAVRGCNVLFADGTVQFIMADNVGRLRWEDEKGTSPSMPSRPVMDGNTPAAEEVSEATESSSKSEERASGAST
jgi:prepilin-type processing-associated H-X9-DG protein